MGRIAWLAAAGVLYVSAARADIRDVELNLARVTWNEAGLDSPSDMNAIWHTQWTVAGGRRASPRAVLRAQQQLSSRATGVRTAAHGNARWSSQLAWSDDEPPGWREIVRAPWALFRARWRTLRRDAGALVRAHFAGDVTRACRGRPYAWGGANGLDDRFIARRNAARIASGRAPLVPLDCGDTQNVFFGLPDHDHTYYARTAQ